MTDDGRIDGGIGSILRRGNGTPDGDDSDGDDENELADVGGPPDEADDVAATFAGEDLVIGYPTTDEPVIDDEYIRVPPGEITALVGPNGSGKSTLLKGLADQLSLSAGAVYVDGTAVRDLDAKELARRLGLLSQANVAPDSTTVADLVEHGRFPHRGFFETLTDADRAAIDRAISLTGVDHLRDRTVGNLSGGQKQLVWIAMVVAQETDVLLLDEPTTFLDLKHQLQVMKVVEELRDQGVTVVVVLHDIGQAARYADHVVALSDGAIHARGPPAEVVTEDLLVDVFGIEARVTTTDQGPVITPLRALDGDDGDEGGGTAAAAGTEGRTGGDADGPEDGDEPDAVPGSSAQ